jgi:hypothetical protein
VVHQDISHREIFGFTRNLRRPSDAIANFSIAFDSVMSDAAAPGHDAPPDGDTMPSDLNTSNTTAAFEPTNQGAAGTAGSPAATHAATEPNALLL